MGSDAETPSQPILFMNAGLRREIIVNRSRLPLCVSGSVRLILLFALTSCSIPVLQSPECQAAKLAVREFYSFHFGNDMSFSPESLRKREPFLTREFTDRLGGRSVSADPFTLTSDLPRAFRVGGCSAGPSGEQATVEVILFWKTDTESEQRIIEVRAVKRETDWLIDAVKNAG